MSFAQPPALIWRALMQHVFDVTRRQGINRLECSATRTAVAFYAAVGFATLEAVEVPLGPGISFSSVRMTRAL